MKQLSETERALAAGIDQPAMLAQTERWSAINSGTGNLAGLARQVDELAEAFSSLPGEIALRPPAPVSAIDPDGREVEREHGEHLVLSVRPEAERRVLLTGHMDTVYPADHPFQTGEWIAPPRTPIVSTTGTPQAAMLLPSQTPPLDRQPSLRPSASEVSATRSNSFCARASTGLGGRVMPPWSAILSSWALAISSIRARMSRWNASAASVVRGRMLKRRTA